MNISKRSLAMATVIGALVIGGYSCKTKPPVVEKPKVNEDSLRRAQARLDSLKRIQDEADRQRREKEARERAQKDAYDKLGSIASQIAASSGDASHLMADGFALATSADVPVTIIILKGAAKNDYDKPTTLRKYFEYCKDVKRNPYSIDHLDFDAQNKITAITLLKK